jgi:hypothetical protein
MRIRTITLTAAGLLALSGCATGSPAAQPPGEPYDMTVTVLDDGSGPEACEVVLESFPPQCGGPSVVDWDWDAIEGWQEASGVRWGMYRLVGVLEGDELTLTEPAEALSPDVTPLPEDTGEILQPGGPDEGE